MTSASADMLGNRRNLFAIAQASHDGRAKSWQVSLGKIGKDLLISRRLHLRSGTWGRGHPGKALRWEQGTLQSNSSSNTTMGSPGCRRSRYCRTRLYFVCDVLMREALEEGDGHQETAITATSSLLFSPGLDITTGHAIRQSHGVQMRWGKDWIASEGMRCACQAFVKVHQGQRLDVSRSGETDSVMAGQ